MPTFGEVLRDLTIAAESGIDLSIHEKLILIEWLKKIEDKDKRQISLDTIIGLGLLTKEDFERKMQPEIRHPRVKKWLRTLDEVELSRVEYDTEEQEKFYYLQDFFIDFDISLEDDFTVAGKLYKLEALSGKEKAFLNASRGHTLADIALSHSDEAPEYSPLAVVRVSSTMARIPGWFWYSIAASLDDDQTIEFIGRFKAMLAVYFRFIGIPIHWEEGDSDRETGRIAWSLYTNDIFTWTVEKRREAQKELVYAALTEGIEGRVRKFASICAYLIGSRFSPDEFVWEIDTRPLMKHLLKNDLFFVIVFFKCMFGDWTEENTYRELELLMREAYSEGLELEWDRESMENLCGHEACQILDYWESGEALLREER